MFENHVRKKSQLQTIFIALSTIFSSFALSNQQKSVEEDQRQLANEQFHLVVVGEFSRGKSTFVNAMLGHLILPSSKSPTTAVISKIVYGEKPEYVVHKKSGEVKAISKEEFDAIKAQSEEGPGFLQKVKSIAAPVIKIADIDYVEIRYPLPFCKNHVEVIDTPGTNDLNAGRVEITYNYLRKADAAILVLWATQPLTRSELDFLRGQLIGNQIQDIFVVINGKDNCKDGDETRVVQYVLDQLSEEIQQGLRVFPISSKQALTWRRKENGDALKQSTLKWMPQSIDETGFPAFEEALMRFLDEERGRAKLEKYVARIKRYFDVIESHIQSQYDAANHSTDELRRQLMEMRPKVRKAKADAGHIMKMMEAGLLGKETEIANEAQQTFQQMKQAALSAMDACAADAPADEIRHQIDVATTPIQTEFIDKMDQVQEEWTREAWDKALVDLRGIWADMQIEANNNLPATLRHNFAVQLEESQANVTDTSSELSAGDCFKLGAAGALAVINFGLLPVIGIAAAIFGFATWSNAHEKAKEQQDRKKAIRKQYDAQYEPFVRNTKEQYKKRVTEICKQLGAEVEGRLDDMEQQLASIVQLKDASEGDAAQIRAELSAHYDSVQKMRKELAEVMA